MDSYEAEATRPVQDPAAELPRSAPSLSGIRDLLGERSIVLVGLMGAGKTTIGRRLAAHIGLPFRDADAEIETAAGMTVSDIFSIYGEAAFRDGERRVIARLLGGVPSVLATGGGAFMNQETRARIAERGVSIWLRADHETLMRRVRRRSHRPLLATPDPDETMRRLMADRHPVYARADLTVDSHDGAREKIIETIAGALVARLCGTDPQS